MIWKYESEKCLVWSTFHHHHHYHHQIYSIMMNQMMCKKTSNDDQWYSSFDLILIRSSDFSFRFSNCLFLMYVASIWISNGFHFVIRLSIFSHRFICISSFVLQRVKKKTLNQIRLKIRWKIWKSMLYQLLHVYFACWW